MYRFHGTQRSSSRAVTSTDRSSPSVEAARAASVEDVSRAIESLKRKMHEANRERVDRSMARLQSPSVDVCYTATTENPTTQLRRSPSLPQYEKALRESTTLQNGLKSYERCAQEWAPNKHIDSRASFHAATSTMGKYRQHQSSQHVDATKSSVGTYASQLSSAHVEAIRQSEHLVRVKRPPVVSPPPAPLVVRMSASARRRVELSRMKQANDKAQSEASPRIPLGLMRCAQPLEPHAFGGAALPSNAQWASPEHRRLMSPPKNLMSPQKDAIAISPLTQDDAETPRRIDPEVVIRVEESPMEARGAPRSGLFPTPSVIRRDLFQGSPSTIGNAGVSLLRQLAGGSGR